ncbi:MAG: hypothetical protein EBZ36_10845, partial [Acidobacteria bacterium]|nr:hypothetical protein [Acidobacteriota bacterium]
MQGSIMNTRLKNGLRGLPGRLEVLLVLTVLTVSLNAQSLNPIKFSGKADPDEVRPGQKTRITLTATIEPEWHLYSLTQPPGGPRPTRITIDESSPATLIGTPRQPKPRVAPDPNFSTPGQPPFLTETFENSVDFTLDVEVKADAPTGPAKIVLKVGFQACDDHQCLPPRTRPVEIDLTWDALGADSLLGYRIYRGGSSGTIAPYDFLRDPLGEIFTDLDDALTDGRTYRYQVAGVTTDYNDSGVGEGPRSSV